MLQHAVRVSLECGCGTLGQDVAAVDDGMTRTAFAFVVVWLWE